MINNLPSALVKSVHAKLGGYVPRPVMVAISSGSKNSQWIAELRVATTMFIKVRGLNYRDGIAELNMVCANNVFML